MLYIVNLDFLEKHFFNPKNKVENWSFLKSFPKTVMSLSFLSFTVDQVKLLAQKHHVYMLDSGRINVCGITPANVDHIGRAIHDAVTSVNAHL